jgi:neopullulanase
LDLELALKAGGFKDQLFPMDAQAFAQRVDWCLGLYQPEVTRIQLNPLDSHDTPRFLSIARGDLASLRLALTFLLTYPGAPCIFYGDEIGLSGGHEPECRQPFPWGESSWNHEIRDLTRRLIQLRLARRELRWGDFGTLHAEAGVYAFRRSLGDAHTVSVLNASEEARTIDLELGELSGTRAEILSGSADVLPGNTLGLRIPPRGAVVLGFGTARA